MSRWLLRDRLLRHQTAASATIALFVSVTYAWGLRNQPVWDDALLTRDNANLASLRGCVRLFTHDMWSASAQGDPGIFYRPVAMLSFAINRAIGGNSEVSYHVGNVLLHIAAAVVLLACITSMSRTPRGPGSMVAALTFAILPMHVEAVAWTSGRFDLLASLLAAGAFLCHVRTTRFAVVATTALFGLALLSKESALCLPMLLVLHDALFDRSRMRHRWVVYLSLALVVVAYIVGRRAGGIHGLESLATIGAGQLAEGFAFSLLTFLPKLIWPVGLDAFHVFRPPSAMVCFLTIGGALLLAAALSLLHARIRQTWSLTCLFGWLWFLLALAPVAVAGPRLEMIGDRYAYLPSMGLALSFAALIDEAYLRISALRARRIVLAAAAVVLTGVWTGQGLVAARRVIDWKDEQSVFDASVRADPENHIAYRSLAAVAARRGDLSAAERHVRRSLAIAPDGWRARLVLCYVLLNRNELDGAEQACLSSLRGFRGEPRTWVNLASVYARQRRWADCARASDEALALKDAYAEAHYLRAVSSANLRWFGKAELHAREALSVDPQHAHAAGLLRQLEQRQRDR